MGGDPAAALRPAAVPAARAADGDAVRRTDGAVVVITNPAAFQGGDEMRRIQRIAYWTKVLADAHDPGLAATATARDAWTADPAWQPLRETASTCWSPYDWGEAFTALNLVVKPAVDAVVDWQLSALAARNADPFLELMFAEFQHDANRSRRWSGDLVRYALAARPELAEVLTGWVEAWSPRALQAAKALGDLFAAAPHPLPAAEVVAAVQAEPTGPAPPSAGSPRRRPLARSP